MVGSNTLENIASHLQNVKAEWNLPSCIAVTDNAANERKAFEILDWTYYGCYTRLLEFLELNKCFGVGGQRKESSIILRHTSNLNDILMEKQVMLGEGNP